jgi:hypothetical protein
MFNRILILLGAALMFSGCATSYRFKVDSIKNHEVPEGALSYRIASANPEMTEDDLRFKEAAKYVKTALSSKGMYEAPEGTEADMNIELDFGMEEPRITYQTMSEPVYVTKAGATRTIMVAVRDKEGKVRMVPQIVHDPPTQELIGFADHVITVTVYEKYMRITARETADEAGDRPPRELWSVYVSNEDQSDDLREYVPLMVSASMDSINQNSSQQSEVVLKKDDERVVFVSEGM